MAASMACKGTRRVLHRQGISHCSRIAIQGTFGGSAVCSDCVPRSFNYGMQGTFLQLMNGAFRGMSSSSDKGSKETQREDVLETGKRVDFNRVKEVPPPARQKWWKPDPVTGVWVPEDSYGQHVDTAQDLELRKIQESAKIDLDKAAADKRKKKGKK